MEGMYGSRLRSRGEEEGGAAEDKGLFTHVTQSERTAKEPGVWCCLIKWVIGCRPC